MVEGLVGLSVSQSRLHHTLAPRWGTPQLAELASQLLASDLAASPGHGGTTPLFFVWLSAWVHHAGQCCAVIILLMYICISIALAARCRVRHHPASSVTGQLPCPVVPFQETSAQSARCFAELRFQQPGLLDVN